jgi:hypothetical protein
MSAFVADDEVNAYYDAHRLAARAEFYHRTKVATEIAKLTRRWLREGSRGAAAASPRLGDRAKPGAQDLPLARNE